MTPKPISLVLFAEIRVKRTLRHGQLPLPEETLRKSQGLQVRAAGVQANTTMLIDLFRQ